MTTRDFRLYWWAGSTDALGTQASGLALPLLLLATGTSPAVVGLLAGASMACGLLLAPFAAVLADRGARRTVMLASALVSAAAMASIAAVAAWSVPALWHLFAAVAVERVATSCYEAAARGTLAVIVPPSGYTAAVSRLQAGEQAALVVGPLLGGALFQLARWLPFVADAASYLVTAVCVRAMRSDLRSAPDARQPDAAPGRAPEEARDGTGGAGGPGAGAGPGPFAAFRTELVAGFAFARTEPLLRFVLLWTTAVSGLLAALSYGTVFTLHSRGTAAAPVGAVLAVAGAAGLAGALLAPRLNRLLPADRLVPAVSWLLVPLALGLAFGSGLWVYGALFGALALLLPIATVVLQARAIAATPPLLQSRTGTALATSAGATAALAPVAAGALAAFVGPTATASVCAALLAVLALRTTASAARGTLREGT